MYLVDLKCTIIDPARQPHDDKYTWRGDVDLSDAVRCAQADASLAFIYLYGQGTQVGFTDAVVRDYTVCTKCGGHGKTYNVYGESANCPSCYGKGYRVGKAHKGH